MKTKLIIRRTLTGETSGQYSIDAELKEIFVTTNIYREGPRLFDNVFTTRRFRYSGRKTRGGIEIWLEVQ